MKKIISLLMIAAIILTLSIAFTATAADVLWDGVTASAALSGSGTDADPYIIANGEDLAFIRKEINGGNVTYAGASYKQTADINLRGYNVEPIGPTNTDGTYLTGKYDGNGYKIENFVVNSSAKYVGLFGYIAGATLKNITVSGASVSSSATVSSSSVGSIVGYINVDALVSGCFADETCYVEAINIARVGGIVGWNYASTISHCVNAATVVYNGNDVTYVGGITSTLGKANGVIEYCVNTGTIFAYSSIASKSAYLGGIVGLGGGSTGSVEIRNCYNTGAVVEVSELLTKILAIGGICGPNNKGQVKITDCYNLGVVYSASGAYNQETNYVGAILGYTTTTGNTGSNCYSLPVNSILIKANDTFEPVGEFAFVDDINLSIMLSTGGSTTMKDAVDSINSEIVSASKLNSADWKRETYETSNHASALEAAKALEAARINVIDGAPSEGTATPFETTAVTTATPTTTQAPTTTAATPVTTAAPVSTTAEKSETTVPVTTNTQEAETTLPGEANVTTAAPDTTPVKKAEGCGSGKSTSIILIMVTILGSAAFVTFKKK